MPWSQPRWHTHTSTILYAKSCFNSKPPAGIVVAIKTLALTFSKPKHTRLSPRTRKAVQCSGLLFWKQSVRSLACVLWGEGRRCLEELWWQKLQIELQQCDKSNNNILCMFLHSWVSVLQSRHTSVCQFLKDMILKWNYCANKSFLLLLKFVWVISGKEKKLAECILLSI